MAARKSAIPPDEKGLERTLGQISAAEFLQMLGRPDVDRAALGALPEKKKLELWVEEGGLPRLPAREFFERLKREKKKLELEINDGLVFDPRGRAIDPVIIDAIADRVVEKLRNRT